MSSNLDNNTWYKWKYGNIKKLDGTNYEDWKRSVQSALTVVDAFDIVTGEEQQPPVANSTAAKAATDNYRKRRALAAHLLKQTCMPNIQAHVRDLVDPKEIWDTLLKRLDFSASQTGRATILTRFLNTRPMTGEKVRDYIVQLQTYQTQLLGTNKAITAGLLVNRIYDTVPAEFQNLVTILREQPNLTIETIIARLSLHEEEHHNRSSNGGVALYTQGSNSNSGRGQGRGKGRNRGNRGGQSRGGQGYWNRSNGQQDYGQDQPNRRNLADVVCYQCSKMGHYRRDCPLKEEVDEAIRAVKRQRTQSQSTGWQGLVATNQETSQQPDDGTGLIE